MQADWEITTAWESLDQGSDEERACFAALGIRAHSIWLTEGHDRIANRLRRAPYLSAYALAEWMAWNWWRLRWEPRSLSAGWNYAHRMASIGGGYIWPNVTISSDGERTVLLSRTTPERATTPYRYINQAASVISAHAFERGVDGFIEQVLERLEAMSVRNSNLTEVWSNILEERSQPELGRQRKIEALMGLDPDDANPDLLERLLADADCLGVNAIEELAAEAGRGETPIAIVPAQDLVELAKSAGVSASLRDGVRLKDPAPTHARADTPAWQLGAEAAKCLRVQEGLGEMPINNAKLAELIGVNAEVLHRRAYNERLGISFALENVGDGDRILLRSRYGDGRRFELARLLGDRLVSRSCEALCPATRADTYRQKAQRAFAAELLSPFDHVIAMLESDYTAEHREEVAEYFQVSELAIRTQLVNHDILDRDVLEPREFALLA